jgi:hypothetical protein
MGFKAASTPSSKRPYFVTSVCDDGREDRYPAVTQRSMAAAGQAGVHAHRQQASIYKYIYIPPGGRRGCAPNDAFRISRSQLVNELGVGSGY